MRLIPAFLLLVTFGCGDSTPASTPPDAPATPDGASVAQCSNGHGDKIAFAQADGCANDGSVEFCIPDQDPALVTSLQAISSSITCAPGGGRAGCLASPGLLLCTYPTAFPTECASQHGAMTDDTWASVCDIAALPQVTRIVQTILE